MGITVGELIRKEHHLRSANFVLKHKEKFLLDELDSEIIALMCEGHRLDSLDDDRYENRNDPGGRAIRVRLLTALLQIADELDMNRQRAPMDDYKFIQQMEAFTELSRQHWMKHYYTESVSFRKEKPYASGSDAVTVKVNVDLTVPDETHYNHIAQQVDKNLRNLFRNLEPYFAPYGFTVDLGDIKHNHNPMMKSFVLHYEDVHILYADDDHEYRNTVQKALQRAGFRNCVTVEDASGVIRELAKRQPPASTTSQEAHQEKSGFHVVILGRLMPDLDGELSGQVPLDLIIPIKKMSPGAQIIVYTSDEDDEIRQLGIPVISKDQSIDELARETEKAIDRNYILVREKESSDMAEKLIPNQYRVLVIDDDPEWRGVAKDSLVNAGIFVETADSGKSAKELLDAGKRYHAAIIDRMMPGIDGEFNDNAGIELLNYLQGRHEDISCFIWSTIPTIESYKEAVEIGMFDYRDKDDITTNKLVDIVKQMFEKRLVTLYSCSGMPSQADRMHFFIKEGVVTRTVTKETGNRAGCIEVDSEKWKATTHITKGSTTDTIPKGARVQCFGIARGAIQVISLEY